MEDFEKFYNSALRFLSYRPRSEKEVRNKLKVQSEKLKIEDSSMIIDRVIGKLKKYNFLNDLEFAKKWIENRMRFKPRSLRLIKAELKQKGISEEIIESIIHDSKFMIQGDLEQARRLLEKKIGRSRNKFGMTPEKLGRYLASKGFGWDTIKKTVDESLRKGV